MIIRITVNDNDYYYEIMGFIRSMWNFRENKNLSVSEKIDAHNRHYDIINLINPNNSKTLTEEDKKTIISYVKEQFVKYANSNIKEDTRKYLIESLEIKILKTFTDKWENGEAFYWFQHSNRVVNQ